MPHSQPTALQQTVCKFHLDPHYHISHWGSTILGDSTLWIFPRALLKVNPGNIQANLTDMHLHLHSPCWCRTWLMDITDVMFHSRPLRFNVRERTKLKILISVQPRQYTIGSRNNTVWYNATLHTARRTTVEHRSDSLYLETISCMCPTNERQHYNVTSSLVSWAHTQSDPCVPDTLGWTWSIYCEYCGRHSSFYSGTVAYTVNMYWYRNEPEGRSPDSTSSNMACWGQHIP